MPKTELITNGLQSDRYRAILEGARSVIASSGFRATTMKAVADEAGCSTGLIYSYFANRDELLRGAFEHAAQHELAKTAEALQTPTTAAGAVAAMVETFVSRAFRGRQLAAALLFQAVPEIVEASRLTFRLQYCTLLVPHITRGIERGELPPQNAMVASQAVNGAVANALQEPLLTGDNSAAASVGELIAELTTICTRAIGARQSDA